MGVFCFYSRGVAHLVISDYFCIKNEVMTERYINPHTDFGFKRLFGSEFNKDLLISFLNALLAGEQHIVDITYMNAEQLGEHRDSRRAIFDVYCRNDRGDRFIVEMQNAYQEFFKDRTVYYSTFPIREQSQRGENWDFQLDHVYTVGLLNFVFDEDKDNRDYFHHEVMLMDVNTKKVFYDKLTLIYIEIPKFHKREDELQTMFDKWMFVLRNLSRLMERPAALQERIFTKLFDQAEIARFDAKDLKDYEDSVNAYRDIINAINTEGKRKYAEGREEGRAEGRAEGAEIRTREFARIMLQANEPVDKIMAFTGLTESEIEELRQG